MLNFLSRKKSADSAADAADIAAMIEDFSIEVMPRTAAKVENFRDILPAGTRVYIAHIEGTPIEDMVSTAKRIRDEGFPVMPHFPARIIKDKAILEDWIKRYVAEAGVDQALLLGGGVAKPHGDYDNSMQLLETGLFEQNGFKRLHVAGHPEGNKDIDPDGSMTEVDKALKWKQEYSTKTDAEMAIVTQFAFDAKSVVEWAERLRANGITMPIHIGIAGPTKLQTLIKFSIACGVGPSLKVLQKRAMDLSKLLVPYEPDEVLAELGQELRKNPDNLIKKIHFFPLGGIKANAEWAREHGAAKA